MIVTIWLRNVLLNQLILIPTLSAVMLAAFFFYFFQQWRLAQSIVTIPFTPLLAVVLLASTLPFAIRNLSDIVRRQSAEDAADKLTPGFRTKADPWVVPIIIFVAP